MTIGQALLAAISATITLACVLRAHDDWVQNDKDMAVFMTGLAVGFAAIATWFLTI